MLTAVASSSKWGNAAPSSSRSTCGNAASAEMRGTKRNRTDSITATGTGRRPRTVPVWSKGSQPTQHLDPISCGIVSESEAERLFDLYVECAIRLTIQILLQMSHVHARLRCFSRHSTKVSQVSSRPGNMSTLQDSTTICLLSNCYLGCRESGRGSRR